MKCRATLKLHAVCYAEDLAKRVERAAARESRQSGMAEVRPDFSPPLSATGHRVSANRGQPDRPPGCCQVAAIILEAHRLGLGTGALHIQQVVTGDRDQFGTGTPRER